MTAEEILDTLCYYQETVGWLANDGRQHLADARLTVLRSDEHFAVFAQFPHFSYGPDNFYNWVGCAGNCLIDKDYPLFDEELPLQAVPDTPPWREDEHYIHWIADRTRFSVSVQGQRYDFQPSREEYERAGIIFEDERSGPNTINPGQLLYFLCVALDHPFFCSEGRLRKLIEPSIAPQMSLFLQTSWWQHPKFLVVGDDRHFENDWIEKIPCWQILAQAIASGDLSEWNAQDTSGFNTDWESLENIYHKNNSSYGFE